jgi:hypothetical protein
MSTGPDILPIPTYDDYNAATTLLDEQYSDGHLTAVTEEMAKRFPRSAMITLGKLAGHVNPVDKRTLERPYDHRELCRALAFGATTGIMIGQVIYEKPIFTSQDWTLETVKGEDDDDESDYDTMDQPTFEPTDEIRYEVGDQAKAWLDYRASRATEDIAVRPWFPYGTGLILEVLHRSAVSYNEQR